MTFPGARSGHTQTAMRRRPSPGPRPRCQGKRRYRSQGDALDAALVAGVERHRRAYLCPDCGHWHLTSASR